MARLQSEARYGESSLIFMRVGVRAANQCGYIQVAIGLPLKRSLAIGSGGCSACVGLSHGVT